jgi:DNA-binding LacI/PurR family transcriptional regulator
MHVAGFAPMVNRTTREGPRAGSPGLSALLRYVQIDRATFAERIGVALDSVNNWCSQRALPTPRHLDQLTAALLQLGVPADMMRNFLVTHLARHGLSDAVLRTLTPDFERIGDSRSYFFIGSQFGTAAHQMLLLGFSDSMQGSDGDATIYLDTCNSPKIAARYLDLALRSAAQGVAIALPEIDRKTADRFADRLADRGVPCVFVDMGIQEPKADARSVNVDNAAAAALATDFLWSHGHRRIVALAADGMANQMERVRGYEAAMRAHRAEPEVTWLMRADRRPRPASTADRPDSREAAELIASDPQITAAIALSSHSAKPFARAIRPHGRVLGEDLSLIALGCLDWMHEVASPPITHVMLPFYEVGQRAAEILTERYLPSSVTCSVGVPSSTAIHWPRGGTAACS